MKEIHQHKGGEVDGPRDEDDCLTYIICVLRVYPGEPSVCTKSRSQLASEGQSGMLNHVTMETAGGTCFWLITTWLRQDTGAGLETGEDWWRLLKTGREW